MAAKSRSSKAKSRKKAVKKTARKAVKKAVKKAAKKTVKKTARKAVKKTVKKAVKKTVAPKPLKAQPRLRKKSPLTKPQLKEFRQMLLEKRRSLIGDMTGMQNEALGTTRQEGTGDLSLMPDHPANIASDNYEQEFMLGLLENERALLEDINKALERIDDGVYGICMGTGKRIGLTRLRARPWAEYCIEYARMVEKGLVRPGREDLVDQGEG